MKRMIGFFCILVSVGIACALASGPKTSAGTAPPAKLPDISSFAQELTEAQYDVLCTGIYTAENRGGVWYYKFTTEEKYLYVPAAAFFTDFQDTYTNLNAALTKGLANTRESCSTYHIYKSRNTSRDLAKMASRRYPNSVWKNVSSTFIANLELISSLSGSDVMLQCTMNAPVLFQYSDQVSRKDPRIRGANSSDYVTPSTADQYTRALTRTTAVSDMVTPEFTLSVDKAGTDGVVLKQFFYKAVSSDSGKSVKSNIEIATKLIDVVMAAGKISASSSPAGKAESLYSLFKTTLSLAGQENTGGSYYETKTELLTKDELFCLKSTFTSPFKLKADGDFWEIHISLSDSPSISDIRTELSASFSASIDKA